MEQAMSGRRPRRLLARVLTAGLLGAALVTVGFVGTAAADTITFTGQGTNGDGTCGSFEGAPPAPGGTQTWQFNLTGTAGGATMSATFSDGTTVTNKPEDDHSGNVSKWFIVTNAGASVTSASATRPESDGNPQFVVSHCTAGGELPPPPPPDGDGGGGDGGGGGAATEVGAAGAARAVTASPTFTG
jgi:hypothetical protein